MPLDNPGSGANYVAEFSVSPIPWVTSSVTPAVGAVVRYDFENVASSMLLCNKSTGSHELAYGWTIFAGESVSLDLRFKSLYLMSLSGSIAYDLIVGITGISARYFPELTSSMGYNGVG
jgi:hypothetical protein